MHAAMTGNLAVVRLLVKVPSVDINLADKEGNTALHFASQAGHADVVGVLTLCPNIQIDSRNDAGLTVGSTCQPHKVDDVTLYGLFTGPNESCPSRAGPMHSAPSLGR